MTYVPNVDIRQLNQLNFDINLPNMLLSFQIPVLVLDSLLNICSR
jgi:hypothetical protein